MASSALDDEQKRKRAKAHRDSTNVHLDARYELNARALAKIDFPNHTWEALSTETKRKLAAEARGERVGERKSALAAVMRGDAVKKDATAFSPVDAQVCNAVTTERVADVVPAGAIQENETLDLPALPRSDELYKHEHFAELARKFGRQLNPATARAAWCGCPVMVRRRIRPMNDPKPDLRLCTICECVIWEWHVELNKKFAHMGCAMFFANSKEVAGAL